MTVAAETPFRRLSMKHRVPKKVAAFAVGLSCVCEKKAVVDAERSSIVFVVARCTSADCAADGWPWPPI